VGERAGAATVSALLKQSLADSLALAVRIRE